MLVVNYNMKRSLCGQRAMNSSAYVGCCLRGYFPKPKVCMHLSFLGVGMKIHTIQLAQWREAEKLNIPVVDTTARSGNAIFAPSWDIVSRYKDGSLGETEYEKEYTHQMRISYRNNTDAWVAFCKKDKVAIACYCRRFTFCHRHILANLLYKVCVHHKIKCQPGNEIYK